MRKHEVVRFLNNAYVVQAMADKVCTALLVQGQTDAARHVAYGAGSASNEFIVTVLGIPLTARLEYFKFVPKGAATVPVIAGQFSFFQKVEDKEKRWSTVVRMIVPDIILLPDDGPNVEVKDLDVTTGSVIEMRDRLSIALLNEQINAMQSWSHE